MKNLLQQVMEKPVTTKINKSEEAFSTEGLIEKILSGYIANRGPRHQQKKTFAPSTIAYGHGECARYWYLAFDGAVFEDNADAFVMLAPANGTLSHARIQKAMEDAGILKEAEFKIVNNDPPIFGYGGLS